MDINEIQKIIASQINYFASGKTKDVEYRITQLKRLKNSIIENEQEIIKALNMDLHKSEFEAYSTEIGIVVNEINYMLKNIRRLTKPKRVKTPLMYFGGASYRVPEPLGIALIIGPWNYPFQLAIAPLAGAIAAGNCAYIKPSEYSYHTTLIMRKIIKNSFPEEYIAIGEGGVGETRQLLEQKFDYIFFTGGIKVGRLVMEAASKNLTPITLELGGKSPCIVDKNIDMDKTVRRIVWGKYLNSGQTCVAPDYLLIHKDIKEEFINLMKLKIKILYGDNPQKCEDYPRIINEKQFDRLVGLLNDGNIITGGQYDKEDRYIAPTIIDGITLESPIMQDEIFGPLFPVIEFSSLDEVIQIVNNKPKPLALYFFSNDREKQQRIIYETSSGGVCINDVISHMTTSYLPFGGVGESGMGSYHGEESFYTFSHVKSILKNSFLMDPSIKYPPYNVSLNTLKKLMKLM